jgi:hypothetical protein
LPLQIRLPADPAPCVRQRPGGPTRASGPHACAAHHPAHGDQPCHRIRVLPVSITGDRRSVQDRRAWTMMTEDSPGRAMR